MVPPGRCERSGGGCVFARVRGGHRVGVVASGCLSARGGVCTFPRNMQYQRLQAISWLLLAAACNGGQTTTLATDTDAGSSTSGEGSTGGSPTSSPTTETPTT